MSEPKIQLPYYQPSAATELYACHEDYIPQWLLNPLVTVAAPLLNLLAQQRRQPVLTATPLLQAQVIYFLKLFTQNAKAHGYAEQEIEYAHYYLCALWDNFLQQPGIEKAGLTVLLEMFHPHTVAPDIVEMLQQLTANAAITDLLELIYLCFINGYQTNPALSPQELTQWQDFLYQIIREQRGEIKKELLILPPPELNQSAKLGIDWTSYWVAGIVLGILLIVIMASVNYALRLSAQPVYNMLHTLQG